MEKFNYVNIPPFQIHLFTLQKFKFMVYNKIIHIDTMDLKNCAVSSEKTGVESIVAATAGK